MAVSAAFLDAILHPLKKIRSRNDIRNGGDDEMEISGPTDVNHNWHVGFDAGTGEISGVPPAWLAVLQQLNISSSEQRAHPTAIVDVMKAYETSVKRSYRMKYMKSCKIRRPPSDENSKPEPKDDFFFGMQSSSISPDAIFTRQKSLSVENLASPTEEKIPFKRMSSDPLKHTAPNKVSDTAAIHESSSNGKKINGIVVHDGSIRYPGDFQKAGTLTPKPKPRKKKKVPTATLR